MEHMDAEQTTQILEILPEEVTPILTADGLRIFKIVNCVVLSTAICFFGIIANVINIMVFYRRGLNNTVNISLFGISLSDLGSLITTLWVNICLNPYFEESSVPMITSEIQYLTAGWPHVCFARITCWITVYVTAERCTCISVPLKVKHIFTPLRTKITICVIYIVMILSIIPEYVTAYIDWKFYPPRNKTVLGLVYTNCRDNLEGLVFVLNSTLGLLSFAAVMICTIILVWKLKVTARWRQNSTFYLEQFQNFSLRDKKTVNMIVLIAVILIICYTPGTALLMATFFEPEFNVSGKYVNTFLAAWTFGLLLEAVNSSVNIFLYYKMSTHYRQTFRQLFSKFKRGKSTSTSEMENGNSYVNMTLTGCVERSDSDVMYEFSTDFGDHEVSCLNNPQEGNTQS